MHPRACPPWIGYLLALSPRRLVHDPGSLLGPFVRKGMTVLEPGPGMGFFTLELARRVGDPGRVVVVDIQPRMLGRLKRRAENDGLLGRLDVRLVQPASMGLEDLAGQVDFAFAFAVVHEISDAELFFQQCAASLKPDGSLLVAEPSGHVSAKLFEKELAAAARAGLIVADRPVIRRSRAALLRMSAAVP